MTTYSGTRLGTDELATTLSADVENLDLGPGIAAAVADPLWMLGRQWQLGEFTGEDAASPVRVDVEQESSSIALAGPWSPNRRVNPMLRVPSDVALEPLVEREVVTLGPAQFAHAAEAGLHLLRLLDQHGVGHLKAPVRTAFPLTIPPMDRMTSTEEAHSALVARRSLNGFLARLALRRVGITAASEVPGVPVGDRPAYVTVLTEWSRWYDDRFLEPSAVETLVDAVADGELDPTPHWDERRLAYGVHLAVPDPGPTAKRRAVHLRAESYHGGRLDWDDFDIVGNVPVPDVTEELATTGFTMLPTPIRFGGMPAQRFWEFEPWEVDLGGIEAGPAEPARMLLAEFGLVFGDDWFQIPLQVAPGSISRLTRLRVTDTFGQVTRILPAAHVDSGSEPRAWAWTEQSGDVDATSEVGPWLFVPPVLAPSFDGEPVEDVLFARDEMANLAWAIERRVENPLGRRFDRRARWQDRRQEIIDSSGVGEDAHVPEGADVRADVWRYVAETLSPSHWVPLAAMPIEGGPQVELRRGRMAQWEHDTDAGAKSQSLMPWAQRVGFNEEEIPSEGTRVTRGWQLARSVDGGVRLWMARRRRTGSGERESGYLTDAIIRRRSR